MDVPKGFSIASTDRTGQGDPDQGGSSLSSSPVEMFTATATWDAPKKPWWTPRKRVKTGGVVECCTRSAEVRCNAHLEIWAVCRMGAESAPRVLRVRVPSQYHITLRWRHEKHPTGCRNVDTQHLSPRSVTPSASSLHLSLGDDRRTTPRSRCM